MQKRGGADAKVGAGRECEQTQARRLTVKRSNMRDHNGRG
jgi:hypothetical protein